MSTVPMAGGTTQGEVTIGSSTAGLFTVVLHESRLCDVLPPSLLTKFNPLQRQKALALIGDRLIDLKLYEQLLLEGEKKVGFMTQTRSMTVANSNLARCGEILFTPCIVSKKAYNKLSMHERGTMVEAYVGALYEQCSYRISQELSVVLETMISLLRHFVSLSGNHNSKQEPVSEPSSIELQTSQFKEHQHLKKAKSILLEVMQKRGVTNAASFFSCKSVSKTSKSLPPFIASFEPTFDMSSCGLPDTGLITGEVSITKKEAEESCSAKVLNLFHEYEKNGTIKSLEAGGNRIVEDNGINMDKQGNNSVEDNEGINRQNDSTVLGKRALYKEDKEDTTMTADGERERRAESIRVAENLKKIKEKRILTKEKRSANAKKYLAAQRQESQEDGSCHTLQRGHVFSLSKTQPHTSHNGNRWGNLHRAQPIPVPVVPPPVISHNLHQSIPPPQIWRGVGVLDKNGAVHNGVVSIRNSSAGTSRGSSERNRRSSNS